MAYNPNFKKHSLSNNKINSDSGSSPDWTLGGISHPIDSTNLSQTSKNNCNLII